MSNLKLERKRGLSAFRQMAIGTWKAPQDPQAYGRITLAMDEALRYLDAFRAATGKHLTVTHMFAWAIGRVLEAVPDANAILRFNRVYLRRDIAVFFQVAMRDPKSGEIDLSGVKIDAPEKKSLAAIADEFEAHAALVRAGKDRELERTRQVFRRVPPLLIGKVLDAIDFFAFKLNLDMRWAGVPRDPYGSVLVTNVGTLGLEEAWAPLLPQGHVGLIVALGEIREVPVVRDGAVVPGKVMAVCATFDHRLLDGVHASRMITKIREIMEDPFGHFEPLEGGGGAGSAEGAGA